MQLWLSGDAGQLHVDISMVINKQNEMVTVWRGADKALERQVVGKFFSALGGLAAELHVVEAQVQLGSLLSFQLLCLPECELHHSAESGCICTAPNQVVFTVELGFSEKH